MYLMSSSGIIFLLTGRRTFIFTSPVALYRFLQPMSVPIFTLNTAAACANVWPSFATEINFWEIAVVIDSSRYAMQAFNYQLNIDF